MSVYQIYLVEADGRQLIWQGEGSVTAGYRLKELREQFPDEIYVVEEVKADPVNPTHYGEGTYECRKVIAAWGLNFFLGNAVKYINRAGKKGDAIEDLKKAIKYLEFEIEDKEFR